MVQTVLGQQRERWVAAAKIVAAMVLLLSTCHAGSKAFVAEHPPDILMDGGRRLVWEKTFDSEREVRPKKNIWKKLVDVVVGPAEEHVFVRPYAIAVDSHGRVIVTDPGARGVHVFDFKEQKYRFLERREARHDAMQNPQGVAVDDKDRIYVTDSELGKIFVFEPNGKFVRAIGGSKRGEGFFKRPTGIAVDSETQRIYVTDTLRYEIFVLDMDGTVLEKFGKSGRGIGEFNLPTELLLNGKQLAVVDAMNFRVQVFDRGGNYESSIGRLRDGAGGLYRPKGIAADSEGHLYIVDAYSGLVQVFDSQNRLLYYFGGRGTELGRFQLPSGLCIDKEDRIFVVDTFNARVQVFRYFGAGRWNQGGVQ